MALAIGEVHKRWAVVRSPVAYAIGVIRRRREAPVTAASSAPDAMPAPVTPEVRPVKPVKPGVRATEVVEQPRCAHGRQTGQDCGQCTQAAQRARQLIAQLAGSKSIDMALA